MEPIEKMITRAFGPAWGPYCPPKIHNVEFPPLAVYSSAYSPFYY